MPEQVNKTPCCMGLLAHVDAGKTTLSEALLYTAGQRRTFGRVDHGNAFLDSDELERRRGITIYAKTARFSAGSRSVTLVDTPGHADLASEAERVLPILDCGVLVISAADGVQAHTRTLWQLLGRYSVPTFVFVNKMDLPGANRQQVLEQLRTHLGEGFVDVEQPSWQEEAAMVSETAMEEYLSAGELPRQTLENLVAERKLFPCVFGSALQLQGVDKLLGLLERMAPRPRYSRNFGARVYKITRDDQGTRLTWVKVTGGTLRVRQEIDYVNQNGQRIVEKVSRIRLYSGEKFETAEEVSAGECCAVQGLTQTWCLQGLGEDPGSPEALLEPVMHYSVTCMDGTDPQLLLPKLRLLEEEDPQLRILWENGAIRVSVMGRVQAEIFQSRVRSRFGVQIQLTRGSVAYRETIEAAVEGVGHYEPLRHYAEVHLLLEPLPRGRGLVFAADCPEEVLEPQYQNLVLTHLAEKQHRGVLLGAPITDMRITLRSGRAHLKHTEGGDFRQATYRAVRQGLMEAKSVLLEPWYEFTLTLPTAQIGRAITDIRAMGGKFDSPQAVGEESLLQGRAPVSQMLDYAQEVVSYSRGRGRLSTRFGGYDVCVDPQKVLSEHPYDPEGDPENPPGSVFCAHGAGFYAPWNRVKELMHLESCLEKERIPQLITQNLRLEDKELERIMERTYGPQKRPQVGTAASAAPAKEKLVIQPLRKKCLIVDGYNIIFAWEDLAQQAKTDLEIARRQLVDRLRQYRSLSPCYLVAVFDGYKVRGSRGSTETLDGVQVVFTGENETADAYIERLAGEIGGNYAVRVASSDALVHLSGFRSGVLRLSARELREEMDLAFRQARELMGDRFQSRQ